MAFILLLALIALATILASNADNRVEEWERTRRDSENEKY